MTAKIIDFNRERTKRMCPSDLQNLVSYLDSVKMTESEFHELELSQLHGADCGEFMLRYAEKLERYHRLGVFT